MASTREGQFEGARGSVRALIGKKRHCSSNVSARSDIGAVKESRPHPIRQRLVRENQRY